MIHLRIKVKVLVIASEALYDLALLYLFELISYYSPCTLLFHSPHCYSLKMPSLSPHQSLCIFWTVCLRWPDICRAWPHTSFRCLPNCLLGAIAERIHTYTHSCWLLSAPLPCFGLFINYYHLTYFFGYCLPPPTKKGFFSLKKLMLKNLSFSTTLNTHPLADLRISTTSNTHPLADLRIVPHFPLSRSFIVAVRVALQRASQPSWIVFL